MPTVERVELEDGSTQSMKECTWCRVLQSVDCFGKDKNALDGFTVHCRPCGALTRKRHRERKKAGEADTYGKRESWDPKPSDILGAWKEGGQWFIEFREGADVPDDHFGATFTPPLAEDFADFDDTFDRFDHSDDGFGEFDY